MNAGISDITPVKFLGKRKDVTFSPLIPSGTRGCFIQVANLYVRNAPSVNNRSRDLFRTMKRANHIRANRTQNILPSIRTHRHRAHILRDVLEGDLVSIPPIVLNRPLILG